jgi:hypothetical protein
MWLCGLDSLLASREPQRRHQRDDCNRNRKALDHCDWPSFVRIGGGAEAPPHRSPQITPVRHRSARSSADHAQFSHFSQVSFDDTVASAPVTRSNANIAMVNSLPHAASPSGVSCQHGMKIGMTVPFSENTPWTC